MEGLDRERVREWMAWFGDFKARVEGKVAEMTSNPFCNFPAAAYGDHSGGGVAPGFPSSNLCFPSNNSFTITVSINHAL